MLRPLDEAYLRWLYSQIASSRVRTRNKMYWKLARVMYTTEFLWVVPNDDNRVEDGKCLRGEFLKEARGVPQVDDDWLELGCSFLEMVIALSRRLAFEAERVPSWWFWQMMRNLGLDDCTDASETTEEEIRQVLDRVIWRTYRRNGHGGLFPLDSPALDQRKVELWYQLNAYLLENNYM